MSLSPRFSSLVCHIAVKSTVKVVAYSRLEGGRQAGRLSHPSSGDIRCSCRIMRVCAPIQGDNSGLIQVHVDLKL